MAGSVRGDASRAPARFFVRAYRLFVFVRAYGFFVRV
jgi:hypothetical protein